MSLLTSFLQLFKWDTSDENDLEQQFDIDKAMNDNWDKLDEAIEDLDTNKVDKVDGKGLSTNDFTNEDKEKLDGLENYDDTEITQEIEDIQEEQTKQNEDIEDLKQINAKQDDLIQKLKDNSINVTTEEVTSLQVQDASTLPAKLDVRGNQSQETREGYNIWDYLSAVLSSAGGLTIEKDYENGYITVNGMPSKDYVSIVSTAYITNLLEDGQRYTLWQENYQNEETAGIYLQVARTDDNGTTRYYSLSNSATFLVDKSNNASYSIILQTSTVANTKTLSNYKNRYMLYKGTEDKTYELPGASPSLDYPSEVRTVGDNVNILPNNAVSTSHNGVNYTINEDGSIYAVGTATSNSQVILAGQLSATEEVFKFKKSIQYKNVGNVRITYRKTDGDYGQITPSSILVPEEDITVGCLYIEVIKDYSVDVLYYPKLVEYYEGMDESYSPYGQGSVEIKKINKNLFNIPSSNNSGVEVVLQDDGSYKLNGTSTANWSYRYGDYILLQPGFYTIFAEGITGLASCIFGVRNEDTGFVKQITPAQTSLTFEITENIKVKPYFTCSTSGVYNNNIVKVQLEKNNIATNWMKHEEQSLVLDIQKPMLRGDYFVKEADGWKEVHTFGYVNTREVENLGVSLNTSNGEFRRYNAHNLVTDRKSGEYLKILCTHFKRTDSRWHENEGICGWETGQSFCIGTFNTNYDTVDKMKTFLQQNDVGIYYELATPTKLDCTEEQSVILDQLSELELFAGTNNIITAESLALMQMQYIADTQSYIDSKLNNINQQILEIAGGN